MRGIAPAQLAIEAQLPAPVQQPAEHADVEPGGQRGRQRRRRHGCSGTMSTRLSAMFSASAAEADLHRRRGVAAGEEAGGQTLTST